MDDELDDEVKLIFLEAQVKNRGHAPRNYPYNSTNFDDDCFRLADREEKIRDEY